MASKQRQKDGDGIFSSNLAIKSRHPKSHGSCNLWKTEDTITVKAKRAIVKFIKDIMNRTMSDFLILGDINICFLTDVGNTLFLMK